MTAPLETAPAKALAAILLGPAETANPGIALLDYRDPATFSALWLNGLKSGEFEVAGQQIDLTDSTKQFLLIGNDPPDGINFSSHFTATSWLAAWKVKFSPTDDEKKKGAVEANTRFAVIDSRESRHAQGTARALQTILGAKDAIGNCLVPGVTVLNAPSLTDICKWLKPAEPDNRTVSKDAPHLRDLLKSTIWNELTSDRERHHALSNVLGAFLLPFQAAPWETPELLDILKNEHPFAPFLLGLVNACGGVAHVDKIAAEETVEADDDLEREVKPDWWITDKQREAFSSAVLIDDMSDIWGLFVQLALGYVGSKERNLLTIPTVDFRARMSELCDRLKKVIANNEPLKPCDLIGDENQSDSNFVLFLDLRLELDREFQAELEKLGKKLLRSNRSLPWLTDEGRRDFQTELDAGKTNETLLPRLISLMDPTLPIIIFSSTHRSELIDPFRNYGNIITSFRKPILSGMASDWKDTVADLRSDFTSAMQQADMILKTRVALTALHVEKPTWDVFIPRNTKRIVEIFIDESGDPFNDRDPGFAVGGILVQHDNENSQREFHRVINSSERKWGVSDYEPDRIRANEVEEKVPMLSFFPKRPHPDGNDERDGLNLISSAVTNNSRIAAFALIEPELLRFQRDGALDSSILFDDNSLDNIYHRLLRSNLEMLLFQHPWVDIEQDSFYIHVATREQKIQDHNTRRIWKQAYGLEFKERRGQWGYGSLRSDDVFRLIREILQSRNVLDGRPDIKMARGVVLNDYEDVIRTYNQGPQMRARVNSQLYDPSRIDPKQAHYMADWIARIALYRTNLPDVTIPWFNVGYIQRAEDAFFSLMDAIRTTELDRAITRLDGVDMLPTEQLRDSLLAERYLRQTASTWPSQLSGLQLRRLFAVGLKRGGE
jgi:hypothetical protein